MTAHPYSTDELVRLLRHFWEKATGIDYGQEHEVMRCAADEIESLQAAVTHGVAQAKKREAEIERLRAALTDIATGICSASGAASIATDALAGKTREQWS